MSVNPLDSRLNVIGQSVVSSMNFGASIGDINAMKIAATSNISAEQFSSAMQNNKAWIEVQKNYGIPANEMMNFFSRYNLVDVVDLRGLNVLRAVDVSSGVQNVFVAGSSFPGEFVGGGIRQTGVYGGDVIQAKAFVDTVARWTSEGINMNGAFVTTNSLGGSTLSLAIPNLDVRLGGVIAFGAYGVNTYALEKSNNYMLIQLGLPEGFSSTNDFSLFMDRSRTGISQRFDGLSITNYTNVGDWIVNAPTISTSFGNIVYLQGPPRLPVVREWVDGLINQHPLKGYWYSVNSPNNSRHDTGLVLSVTYNGSEKVTTYANGSVGRDNVQLGYSILSVPSSDNRTITKYTTDFKTSTTKVEVIPNVSGASATESFTVSTVSGTSRVLVTESSGSGQALASYSFETFALSNEGASAGYSVTQITNDFTGAATYQLKNPQGSPVASGSNYSVARNDTVVFNTGTSQQVYDLKTGRLVAQIDADGAGFVVGEGGNDSFYSAGQLNYDANSGVLTAAVGGQTTQHFATTNLVNLSTNTTGSIPTQTPTPESTSAVNAIDDILISNPGFTFVGMGNVNSDGAAMAVGNNMGAQFIPGNHQNVLDVFSQQPWDDPFFATNSMSAAQQGAATNSWATGLFSLIPTDPLVLDLNGDDVKLTNYTDSPVLFDADNDGGSLEQTGWVSSQDGIVVHDLNNDGKINNISETLSEYYNGVTGSNGVAGTKPHANGFAALKSLDSNADNQFTSADAAWSSLRVWVDANHDGKTDANELKTFSDLGITAINLNTTAQSGEVRDGNEVLARGTFTQNGLTREAIAANFLADPAGSTITQASGGVVVSTENTGGGGAITSFVSQNTNSAVAETLNAATLGVRHITGGAGNDSLTGDAQNNWLAGGLGADSLSGGAGDDVMLIDAGDTSINGGDGLDIAQVIGSEGVSLNLSQSNIEIAVGGDGNDVFIGGGRSTVFVRGGAGDDLIIGGAANDVLSGEDGADLIDGGAGNDLIRGHRGHDQLLGGQGDDVLDGGLEDDALNGGAGNDVLIGGGGDDSLNGGDGIDVAQYSGSYADYRITKIKDAASGGTTFRVVDTRTGQDGADTLTNIEKLSFADVSRVDLTLAAPLPAKDVLRVNGSGQALSRTVAHLLSKQQLLGNDRYWDGDTSQLSIIEVLEAKGGAVSLTAQGDVLFTPDAGYTGVMSFKYKVQDAQGNYTQVASPTGQTEAMKAAVYLQTSDLPSDPLLVEQWYLTDTNIIAAWGTAAEQAAGRGYSGKGIKLGQFEPGGPFSTGPEVFDYRHPDLAPNADKVWLNTLDANGNNNAPQTFSNHATMVAGVMVAARNGEGGVGVAYNASLAGHYIQGEGLEVTQLSQEITAALAKFRNYDVVNNSWGPTANFQLNVTPVGLLETGMLDAVQNGRNGLGTAIVMAGGNDREHGANTNYNALTANRAVITVGSINAPGDLGTLQMGSKPFSNPGASILVSAPGSNIDSTSRELISENGSTFGSQYNTSQGTSFAAPIVSGVIALLLEANPKLGYRDIQTILAMSATQFTDPNGTDWTYNKAKNWNGGGMHASHDYGFGKVDARAAVRLAETWYSQTTAGNEQTKTASSATLNTAIPDGAGVLTQTLTMAAGLDVETAQVTLELTHQRWGDLIIKLISPTGTESILVNRPGKALGSAASDLGDANSGTLSFSFNTTHVRGETSGGNWTLQVIDAATGSTGTLKNWKLDLFGATSGSDDVYVYTNEFASTAGRTTLTDTNGGSDIINASAVTGNSTINLNNGSASTLAGKTLTLNGDIEKVFGGDGNDTLIGDADVNVLVGGRGNDNINGGGGGDRLEGGYGNDTLTGGTEDDLFVVHKDAGSTDTIIDFNAVSGAEKIVVVGFDGVTDATQLSFTQAGANVQIGLGQGQSIILSNTTTAQLSEQNFVFVSDASFVDEYATRWNNPGFWLGSSGAENGLLSSTYGDLRATALAGDDVLGAVTANDLLDGGNGSDTLWGDYPGYTPVPGADWIEGGSGSDTLYGGGGGDWLVGGSGDDAEFGEDGNDYLIGNTGFDFLDGGLGNDLITLDGDVGTVNGSTFAYYGTRVGGAGADVFKVLANGGGSAGFSLAGASFSASNLIADFDPNQAGEKIDLRAFSWITSLADLSILNLNINGVQFARISVSNGSQSLNLNIRGVSSSQLTASHFVFSPATPGSVNGSVGNNTLTGDAGANTINGLAGADSMTGRTGDDTYIVDNLGDTVNELPGGGYDSVQSTVTHTLGDNVEALTLTGTDSLDATGNTQRNRLVGNAGSNRLDGGAEADSMFGGAGSDTYVVDDQIDSAYENFNEGTDTVESSVSWTLGSNFENLTLTGTGNINATGNDVSNILAGNSADNIIDGAQGADVMSGGDGNDTFYVDNVGDTVFEEADAGIDTVYTNVDRTLEASVENGTLFGAATTLTGNNLDNVLLGNSLSNSLSGGAGNDMLDGRTGADAMSGGTGDDVYFVDSAGDTVSENIAEGTDTVVASLNYALSANTENLVLTGTSNLSGAGNALDNQMSGNSGNNALNGGAGNDVLDGGAGGDAMAGGTGDDTYYVDAAGDTVAESAGEGTDTVISAIGYSLGANLENLTLSGFGNTNAAGNSLANTLQGNSGNNILEGDAGADGLRGNAGSDALRGGIGNDSYLFALGDGQDIIEEYDNTAGNVDTLSFAAGIASAAVTVSRSNQDLVLSYGASDSVTVKNWFSGSALKIEQVSFADGSNWNVAELTALANLAPIVSSSIAGQAVNEDAAWTFMVPADTFSDADTVIGDSLGYSATLGSGYALPAWLSFDAVTRTFSGTPDNADVGNLSLMVTATDAPGATVSNVFHLEVFNSNDEPVVANPVAAQAATEDASWTYTIPTATFLDVDAGDNLALSATLADGSALPFWLSFDAATRTFSGTPLNENVGVLNFRVTATDTAGASASMDFNAEVANTNDAPTIVNEIANQSVTEDSAWSYTIPAAAFSDVDVGDGLALTATAANGNALPSWLSFDEVSRTFSGTPQNGDVGDLDLKVTATDISGASASSTFFVTVVNTNDAPVLVNSVPAQAADEDGVWSYTVPVDAFTDLDAGDSLAYSATLADGNVLPGWLSFDMATRTFIGTPLNSDVGAVAIRVTATDAAGEVVATTFNVTVTNTNDAPVVSTPILDQAATQNALWTYALPAGFFSDVDAGDSLILSATLADGSALPTWLNFEAATGSFSGIPLGADVGNLALRVIATDAVGATARTTFSVTIAGTNLAPVASLPLTDQLVVETQAFSYVLPIGAFTDADAGDTLAYSAALADGGALPSWLSFDVATQTFSGTPPNTAAGLLVIQLTAVDMAGATATASFNLDIANIVKGTAGAETLTGTVDRDYLYGLAGNDTLKGGAGADSLFGATGNDVYVVDNAGDTVVELASEGTDTVQTSISYSLADNVENLTLTGLDAIDGTGNALNNVLAGNAAINTLSGGAGIDTLNGGAGADTLIGGAGNDIYVVDDASDAVVELAGEGTDTVQASVAHTLADNVENLSLTGLDAIDGVGNALNNVLTGNAAANTLLGGAGNDTLNGGADADTLLGGAGNDIYVVDSAGDTVVELASEGTDTVQASISYSLAGHVENLTLTGVAAIDGTGNALNNTLTGNAAANTLSGGDGNDTLNGAAGADVMTGDIGNDTYYVDNVDDAVFELASEGTDTVRSSIAYTLTDNVENLILSGAALIAGTGNTLNNSITGNAAANTLSGGDGHDILNGGAGADTLIGGAGNDTYYVDNAGDAVIEAVDEGIDLINTVVSHTLHDNVENLTLSGTAAIDGTGNTLNNVLVGNAAANILSGGDGNDSVNGGAGADTLIGGQGDDSYTVDNAADTIVEALGEGIDSVNSSVTHTLAENVENLTLTGTTVIQGTGNGMDNRLTGNAAANTLIGGAGNDTLNGGAGADALAGGTGDDLYHVDNAGDVVTEEADEGLDTVNSSISRTLGANLENLTLTGAGNIAGTGNALNNRLVGNSGVNTLNGGTGDDYLEGKSGSDTLIGGTGNDIYFLAHGYGSETAQENDATVGNTDVALFDAGIATDQLWFRKISNNLEVSVIGTSDKFTISNWYLGDQYHLEQFTTSDGLTLLDSQVQNLVQAMASFAPPAAGETNLSASYHATLAPVIAANWQ